jgi:Domain of unknown function (DUF4124)
MLSNERRATINDQRITREKSIGGLWKALAVMAISLAFTVPSPLVAKTVYQCKGPDGRITLQDQACASGDKQSEQEILDAYRGTPQQVKRSAKAKREFQASNPCPRNGATRGRCPGHDIDHIKPLCAGGADTPANMQWLTLEKHREKTRLDLFECRTLRKRG